MSDLSRSTKGHDSRLAVSGWPLRRKVGLALAIPLLLAAVLGGLRVTADLEESTNASASAQQVTVLAPAIAYLTAAEKGMVAAQSSTGTSQNELDDALIEIKAAAKSLAETGDTADLTFEQRRQVDVILDLSRALREDSEDPVSPGTWIAQLRQMQAGVTQLVTTIINAQLNPEPRLELLAQGLSGRFALAMQQALAQTDRSGRNGSLALFSELGAESASLDRLAGQLDEVESEVQTLRTNNGERTRDVRTGGSDLGGADAYDAYNKLQTKLIDGVDEQLTSTASEARSRAILNALLTLGALAAAIMLALLISRLIVNPIRQVREDALRVARTDLPDAVARIRSGSEPRPITPIDVTTHEEVGQVARAVDDLHQQAVTLASGEARLRSQVGEMFVTLSRRNTTLINQQLNLIETLEKDEEDPKRLESLFRLDHLASRMRRTADSLLILADAPVRSTGWESVSISESLQAATAGVQDYQRVRIESTLAIRVDESAAGDLVHLLTELVDNSLSYSAPNTQVVLSSATTDAGVTITVADSVLGIPVEALAEINKNLRSGVEVTPETARRMGLFVVSRLAQRHGIMVALKANRGEGITASVRVPNAILPERAHLAPVVEVEELQEELQEEIVVAAPVEAPIETPVEAPFEPLKVAAIEETYGEVTALEPLPSRRPAEAAELTVDESDPLGIGDSHLGGGAGLPTRERGATLSHLSQAGLQVPSLGEPDPEPEPELEAPRPIRRATKGMPLLSRRDLDAQAAEAAAETAGSPTRVPELLIAPEPEPEPEPDPEPEPESELLIAPEPAALVDPDPEADPEAHIAALMAKIRPLRGRLPIPDYQEVDHTAILQTPTRERGSLEPQPISSEALNGDSPLYAEPVSEPATNGDTSVNVHARTELPRDDEDALTGSRSSWLSSGDTDRDWSSTEVEAGWERADDVAAATLSTNDAGLPVRRPGARLMPGGVTKTIGSTGRDPEAVRARLSAHKAGVRRGRNSPVSADDQ